jgi:hypothetical protein
MEKKAEEKKESEPIPWVKVVFIVAAVWAILGGLTILIGNSWTERGQIGDMFGLANSLFSGLAFAGVIFAILLQRRELELQREELKMTRGELKRSAEAQEKSEGALRKQAASLRATAKLNAAVTLLEHYNGEMVINNGFTGGSPREANWRHASARKEEILQEIEKIYDEKND